jgi:hypothetical protein
VAIFAFVDAALLKPLPYQESSRLVDVTEGSAMFPRANLSYLDYVDWKKLNTVFSSMDVWNAAVICFRRRTVPSPCRPCESATVFSGHLA